jgi:hypothetical protein
MAWSGDLSVAFPFWRVQWKMYLDVAGFDAAEDWAWRSGLIGTSMRLQRCGLDNLLAGNCDVRVTRVTTVYTDPVDLIAHITQSIAPFVGMIIPGFGTIASVALSAAAAIALGDPLDKAAIEIVASGLPPGPIRQTFTSTSDFLVNVYNGERADRAALHTTRELVGSLGGPQALTAYDAGLAVAQGVSVSDETLALARESVVSSMGFEGALSFDTAVAIVQHQDSPAYLLQISRDFVVQAGANPELVAIYDAGLALAQGETLHRVGFKFLMNIAQGNDLAEKALHFLDALIRSIDLDLPIKEVLMRDVLQALTPLGMFARSVKLPDCIDKLLGNGDMLSRLSAIDVSEYLNVPVALAWASQAAIKQLEDGSHVVDPEVMAILQAPSGGSTTTTLKLASASRRVTAAWLHTSTTVDTSSKYALVQDFAQPQKAVALVGVIQQQAAGGDVDAILAAQALARAGRALARQPWITYYNSLP